jgi:hypothetical protein
MVALEEAEKEGFLVHLVRMLLQILAVVGVGAEEMVVPVEVVLMVQLLYNL